ncbi:MAG: metallophosphoesterase [Proteobacteria bacterium]|nr:metallophosphoesterase [Pseudomonadota bacterium]
MKSHLSSNWKKMVLVISDLHLSAGKNIRGRRNFLEDFHFDRELIDFLIYHSSGLYEEKDVELVINGDFLDFLAVPYVEFFDDEFWSEKAALEKLKIIMKAHRPVLQALKQFLTKPNKTITYIIGNHDAELIFDSLKKEFISYFGPELESKINLRNDLHTHVPIPGVYIQHGHQYERAHEFDPDSSIVETPTSGKFFIPSWGSYYVINIINRYKQERPHINAVRPIKHFIIHGLIFDTFFTLRFILSNVHYYFMVRFWYYIKLKVGWKRVIKDLLRELTLFQDFETLTRDFFAQKPQAKLLIVGHTHNPTLRLFNDGTAFINTGTWTKMVNLDLAQGQEMTTLPYARVVSYLDNVSLTEFENDVEFDLKVWTGINNLPYKEFN